MTRVMRDKTVYLICDGCGQEYETALTSEEGKTPKGFMLDKALDMEFCGRCKEYRRAND